MAGVGGILGTGVSALLAFQRALATTGQNIANVNTPGYTRQEVNLSARTPQLVGGTFIGAGVDVTSVRRVYSEFLTTQARNSNSTFNQLDTLYTFSSRLDSILADPQAGLAPALQNFFDGVQDVADDPGSIPTRQVMLSQGQALVSRFQSLDQWISGLRSGVNSNLRTTVSEINSLTTAIAEVNGDIILAQNRAMGQLPNDLLDKRDALIADLSRRVGVSTVAEDSGAVNVFIANGQSLVMGTGARELQTVRNAYDPTQYEVALGTGPGAVVISDFLSGGTLGGILAFRNEVIDVAQNALGRVAIGLAGTFNDQQRLGQDLNGALGQDLFTVPAPGSQPRSGNTTATNISVSISDLGALTTSDYRLRYDGVGSWTLTDLAGNQQVTMTGTGTNADPFVADGLSISVEALGAAAGDSYSFRIQPTRAGAKDIDMAVSDPAAIAAAAPIRTTASTGNTGSGLISAGSVNTPPPPDANLQQTVTITFNNPPTTFDVSGTGTGNPTGVAYTGGGSISYNGWTMQISGTPAAGDTFVIQANTGGVGDNRNALLLAGLQTRGVFDGGTTTFDSAYASTVTAVATRTRQAQITRDAQGALLAQAENALSSVSGVNLDEEAAALLRFQQAYQAAAQVIATGNSVFQTLLGAIGR